MATNSIVFGIITDAERLLPAEPRFQKAVEFLKRPDLATLPVGKYEIDGTNVYAMVQSCTLRDYETERKVEAHRKYVDIQAPLDGAETYGFGELTEKELQLPFDAEKDVGFYTDVKLQAKTLQPGSFAAFFPPFGAHAPCCTLDSRGTARKKLVIKILR